MSISSEIIQRNNVQVIGNGDTTLLLAHGFGCDQNMWRFISPMFAEKYKVVLFDYVGSGKSDLSKYNTKRYSTLDGYAQDVLDICLALELKKVIFVGHSVSSMIGLLASVSKPELFTKLIMICPSPCFLNFPPDYIGGFDKEDLEELLQLMDKNYIGWANYLAPLVMGTSNEEDLIGELSGSFCSTDPLVAKTFARATFFSDYRYLLKETRHPTLIIQSSHDALASESVGKFMSEQIPDCQMQIINAEGHCLHMTKPDEVAASLVSYVG